MSDDYPTEDELRRVREWDSADCFGLLEYVKDLWSYPDSATVLMEYDDKPGRFYRFATGGWSGNEELIGALGDNSMAWMLTWQMSARGGLHVFEVPRYQMEAKP